MDQDEKERLEAKTPERRFMRVLKHEFHYPPKIAEAILEEAQNCLQSIAGPLRPGQMRVILTSYEAGHGRALRDTAMTEVVWTVDAGREDVQVLEQHGRQALRRLRIQRLLDEALAQGGVATQEDLARALQVSVRTIKRDCAALQAEGICVPTRGYLHGIGRGQTHKARIVGQWLEGATYDQIARWSRHSLSAIQRYVKAFVRVVDLHRRGFSNSQIALLLQISVPLVREYQAILAQHNTPACRERLEEQIERLGHAGVAQKGGL
jgi:biotin operon repressor